MHNTKLTLAASAEILEPDADAGFYELIADVQSITDKLKLLWRFAQNLGFTDIFYCKLKNPSTPSPLNVSNISDYRYGDDTWSNIYRGLNYVRFDWAIERATWDHTLFRLDQPPKDLTPSQEKFLAHARQHNRHNGFCFPLNSSFGLQGGFSATGCDRSPSVSQIMQMTSALQLAELTISQGQIGLVCSEFNLNDRELKLLRMMAAGRSMTQIAHITGKTDQWIRLSFSQIRTKLGVSSNTQLIYRAVKLGII